MKKALLRILIPLLLVFGCTDDPQQPEPISPEAPSVETPQTDHQPRVSARGLAASEEMSFLPNGDTLILKDSIVTFSYTVTVKTIKPFKGTPPPAGNKSPVANAGVDKVITLPTNTTSLAGSGSDPDGTISSYAWSKVSGGAATIATPAAATTTVNGLVQGAYTFRLTVKDNGGLTATDDVKVTVNAAPPTTTSKYLSLPLSGRINASSGQVIENLQFKNVADVAIRIAGVNNVTIRNCFFNGTGEEAIDIENASNVTITNCLFARVVTGVYALNAQTIKVNNNQFVNVRMRSGGGGRGQFVQFNSVSGAGNEVKNNKGENFEGESNPEDMVSLYRSSGTSASPITVTGNMFRGGGPSASGGGIMSGDSGGEWQLVENNKLLNPGNYIVAIAGGKNITVRNNQGYQELKPWSNIGGYAYGGQQGASCSNVTFTGNNLWANSTKYGVNNYYFGGSGEECSNSNISGNISTITIAQLAFPAHLIDFVTPAELLSIRK